MSEARNAEQATEREGERMGQYFIHMSRIHTISSLSGMVELRDEVHAFGRWDGRSETTNSGPLLADGRAIHLPARGDDGKGMSN